MFPCVPVDTFLHGFLQFFAILVLRQRHTRKMDMDVMLYIFKALYEH